MTPDDIRKKLQEISVLPDTAVIPVPVVAVHDGVSERTVRRNYPRVQLTERREGVLLGYLRHRSAVTPA
jgi:hypothetical protein